MKDLELNEMFKVALDAMPTIFTGPAFSKKCNELSFPKFYSNPHKYAEFADKIKIKRSDFLKANCNKLSVMTYEKIVPENKVLISLGNNGTHFISPELYKLDEQKCIKHLLSSGNYEIYRIKVERIKL